MKKLLTASVSALTLLCAAAPAQAATTFLGTQNINPGLPDGSGGLFFSFTYTHLAAPGSDPLGAFQKDFTFTLPAIPGTTSTSLSTNFTQPSQDIDFISVLLNGIPLAALPGSTDQFEHWGGQILVPGGTNTLSVFYNSAARNNRFTGDVTYSPSVPEPATWGMLLLGFGMVGFALRRSEQKAPRVRLNFA